MLSLHERHQRPDTRKASHWQTRESDEYQNLQLSWLFPLDR